MKKYKTTKKQFELFQEECKKWIEIFGLKDWRVEYWHQDVDGARAQCKYSFLDRTIDLYLSINWNHSISDFNIRKSAFHEVCEILFTRVRVLGVSRFIEENEINEEIHGLVRTLENVIFDKY